MREIIRIVGFVIFIIYMIVIIVDINNIVNHRTLDGTAPGLCYTAALKLGMRWPVWEAFILWLLPAYIGLLMAVVLPPKNRRTQ